MKGLSLKFERSFRSLFKKFVHLRNYCWKTAVIFCHFEGSFYGDFLVFKLVRVTILIPILLRDVMIFKIVQGLNAFKRV
jgi:hypothetical protein